MVYTMVLEAIAEGIESSSLSLRTKLSLSSIMAVLRSPKPLVGVRVPRGMPIKEREICQNVIN